jgi:hypothetical protein
MSRAMIHLSIHSHLVTNEKCWESVKETRRLIAEEMDRMSNAKISSISLTANKTFLANYLLDDSSDGKWSSLRLSN